MIISKEKIGKTVANVWSTLIGYPITEAVAAAPFDVKSAAVTACVHLIGPWQGAVAIDIPLPLARDIASAIFQHPSESVSENDINDAVGELANQLTGTLKKQLPDGDTCHLSLPTIVSGIGYSLGVNSIDTEITTTFACRGFQFRIRILYRESR